MPKSGNMEKHQSYEKEGGNPFVSAICWVRDKIKNLGQNSNPESDKNNSAKPQGVDSGNKQEAVNHGRRSFLCGVGAMLGLAAVGQLGDIAVAHAEKLGDRSYENMRGALSERLGLAVHPEQLDENEIKLMDKAMNSLFRHYLQPSFFMYALSGSEDKVKEAMEMAIKHYDKLHYALNKEGHLVITKRNCNKVSQIPNNFKIIIRNGIIYEVNNHEVDLNALENWEKEWKLISEKIIAVNGRIGDEDVATTRSENKWFAFYSIITPPKLRDILSLKKESFGLNSYEQGVLDEINELLKDHPKSRKEWLDGKKLQFYITRKPKGSPNPTPDHMMEFIYPAGHKKQYQTFAAFSLDGFVMENLNQAPEPEPKPENKATSTDQTKDGEKKPSVDNNKKQRGKKKQKAKGKKTQQVANKPAPASAPAEQKAELPVKWQQSSASFAKLYSKKISAKK